MDSSLAMGRLEIAVRRPARISGPVKERGAGAPGVPTPPTPTHLSGCVPLSHQVAGHKYGVDKVGILQHPDGTVLKQLQPPPRGPREMQFYSMVYAEDCSDPCLLDLQRYLPKYYGTWSSPDSPTDLYLNLEDVTRSFKKPCIMDVKIGQRSYDPYASQEKREQQIRKYPLMEEIGYLVLGMRVYNVGLDSFDTYDQHFGRALLKDTVKDGLSRFFYNGAVLRKDAVTASMAKVQKILQWFEGQSQLNFYASSLLFVYEGVLPPAGHPDDADATETEVETTLRKPDEGPVLEYNNNIEQSLCTMYSLHKKSCINSHYQAANSGWRHDARQRHPNANGNRDCDLNFDLAHPETRLREKPVGAEPSSQSKSSAGVEVRMIDFAHVFPSEVKDHGYIYGLKNLLEALRQILED